MYPHLPTGCAKVEILLLLLLSGVAALQPPCCRSLVKRRMPNPVMVFSHPNHELAVLGTILRLRPHIVYLTDGGGEARVNQTKQALEAYEPTSTYFLNHSEQSLYDALLRRDSDFYNALAEQVGMILASVNTEAVYC